MTAQATVIRALGELVGVPVSKRMPTKVKPDRFVLVSRIGGGSDDWAVRNPRFLVECYAHSDLGAESLGELVWESWGRLRSGGLQWGRADNNLSFFADPEPGLFRYQFTGSVQLRAF